MSFFDNFRWEKNENYNLINFYKQYLDDDTKLLTHWLCYITDRQMSFKTIWDVGGFIISELIDHIKQKGSVDYLNPDNPNTFIRKEKHENKYYLISRSDANDLILENYPNHIANKKAKFKSRFFPSDYFAILYTLTFLEDYDFCLSRYMKRLYLQHKNKANFIKRILFGLYLLTYYDIGQPDSNMLANFQTNFALANKRKDKIKAILDDDNKFEKQFRNFSRSKIFQQKRAWCSLRDFLKSPEFKSYFKNALSKENLSDKDFNTLFSLQALVQLELPGDVWNNNPKFRKCILKGTEYENSTKPLNKILRNFYDRNSSLIKNAYPEQFDVTFDFVPRMCEKNNCDICPVDKIENKENDFDKVCFDNKDKFCPVALIGCNYKNNCVGKNECKIA
jgi:hypothetical protein